MDGYLFAGLGLGVPTLVTYLLYRKRRSYCKILEDIKQYSIGDELNDALKSSPDKCLPYASITGNVKADNLPLPLSAGERTVYGVIHKLCVIEHKSEWNKHSSSWDDVKRTINSSQNAVPFSLESENKQSRVEVAEPLLASGLTYTTVLSKFEPVVANLSDNLFSLASGAKVKGYEQTDQMLLEGTKLTGLGRIQISSGGKVAIGPPDRSLKYILSTSSLSQIVTSETNFAKFLKGLSMFFAFCSSIVLAVWLYRHFRKWYLDRKKRLEFDTLESDLLQDNGNECVVCMERARDVVILNCGHICACKQCGDMLTNCPVCRSEIARIIPTFVST